MMLNSDQIDDLKKGLTSSSDFNETCKQRKSIFAEEISVKHKFVEQYLEEGWEKSSPKANKLTQKMGRRKKPEDLFEDNVWCLFAKMGYNRLNKTRYWSLPFGKHDGETKQIDVFAVNDETIVIVECKHTEEKNKQSEFKKELESYQQMIAGLMTAAKELFPDKNLKCKFILATNNYHLSPNDHSRIKQLNGIHLSDGDIAYFNSLYENIGDAAKYQFAGFLFEGVTIPELSNEVPAIKASMGGLTYYSFSIEPDTLLKIGYVPHRNKSNKDKMETYQRLVKGSRLKSIKRFITEEGGFFPNSIIINIKSDRPLQFDKGPQKQCETKARLGVLHLPAKYKSALIIDGQHRLLAYAGTKYATTHTIPVVAFENLDAEQQIKLFMQINQNQKPVEKNLRNTLNSIILDESEILADRIRGMRLRVAESLATDPESWLNGYIGAGVDDAKITSTAIDNGLNMEIFLGKIKKNEILKSGVFFKGDEEKAYENFKRFTFKIVQLLVENVSEVQQPGDDGYILTNRGIYGYLRCIGDILETLQDKGECLNKVDDIVDKVRPFLAPLFAFFNTKIKEGDDETISGLKTVYGGGGDARYYRTFERVIHESIPEFHPVDLDEYWEKFSKDRVEDARNKLQLLEQIFRQDISEVLKAQYGPNWFEKAVPLQTKKNINTRIIEYNDRFPDDPTSKEEAIGMEDFVEIIINNWDLLKETYSEIGVKGERREKLEWINRLASILKDISLKPFIDKANLDFIKQKEEQYIEQ